jgi:hypothetical protein
LERGTCHTVWHRLGLDFVSDDSTVGRLSAYTGCPLLVGCRRIHPSCGCSNDCLGERHPDTLWADKALAEVLRKLGEDPQ